MGRDAQGHIDLEPPGSARHSVRVSVLGPLRVETEAGELHVAGTQRRRLLAYLASKPGHDAAVDSIVDALWGDDPPASAAKTLQAHVVRLRRSLAAAGDDLIVTVPAGYRLALTPDAIDAERFTQLASEGRRRLVAGDRAGALRCADSALELWRGPAFAEFDDSAFATAAGVRLEELRMATLEDRAEAQIGSAATATAIADLERLLAEHPGRERAWELLMAALYAVGRQQHALDAFQRARRVLSEEFGLEPGPSLRAMEQRVLRHDPVLVVTSPAPVLPSALRTVRRMVGRASELSELEASWRAARAGDARCRMLTGEALVGRTRLAAEFAARVADDQGRVEYVRGSEGFHQLVARQTVRPSPGAVVDAVIGKARDRPLLLIVDDIDRLPVEQIDIVDALLSAIDHVRILLLLISEVGATAPIVDLIRRRPTVDVTTLRRLTDDDIGEIVAEEGIDSAAIDAVIAVAEGIPGIALREAIAWQERRAADRVHAAASTSLDAHGQATAAQASVFDEVVSLIAARARRDELVSDVWEGRQPYRALDAYGAEDADLFVGRERLVAELIARVLDRRLVTVTGVSGSGKSSLVRAGLVPLVRSGRLPMAAPWRVHVVEPGRGPLAALDAIDGLDDQTPQLVIVDQFEEVLTSAEADADGFARRLLDLVHDAALDARVVIVVRSDRLPAITARRSLGRLLSDAPVVVGPPSHDELKRIVEVPARRTGCEVEPALTQAVVDDAGGHEATLPLVSAAMAAVWNERVGVLLTHERYTAMGGLATAVELLGAAAIERAGAGHVRAVMLELADVTPEGHWVRRRVDVAELSAELEPAVRALIDARLARSDGTALEVVHEVVFTAWPALAGWLAEVRADVVAARDLQAAATAWATHGRLDDEVYRGIRLDAAADLAQRRPLGQVEVEFLAAGRRVAEAEHVRAEVQLAHERTARRRLRRASIGLAILSIAAVIAAGVALVARSDAETQRDQAAGAAELATQRQREAELARAAEADAKADADDRRAEAERGRAEAELATATAEEQRRAAIVGRLVAESERELDSRFDLALLLAVEAARRSETTDARGAVLTAITHKPTAESLRLGAGPTAFGHITPSTSSFHRFLSGPRRIQYDVDVSADGGIVASGGQDTGASGGLALVFDASTGAELIRLESSAWINEIDVSDDGRFVIARDTDGVVRRLDVESQRVDEIEFAGVHVVELFLLPDGRRALVVGNDESSLWDLDAMTPISTAVPHGTLENALTNDGDVLTIQPADGGGLELLVWDPESGTEQRRVTLADPGADISRFAVSADGHVVAGSERVGRVHLWRADSGAPIGDPSVRPGGAFGLAFDPLRPSVLAIASLGGGTSLFDVDADRVIGEPLIGRGAGNRDVAFSADGSVLVTAGDDGLVGVWGGNDVPGPLTDVLDPSAILPSTPRVGTRVVVSRETADGLEVEVRDVDTLGDPGRAIAVPEGEHGSYAGQLSGDGTRVLAATGASGRLFVAEASSGAVVWSQSPDDTFAAAWAASISPDGTMVAGIDRRQRTLRLWNLTTGGVTETAIEVEQQIDLSTKPEFAADGRSIDVNAVTAVLRYDTAHLTLIGRADSPFALIGVPAPVPGTSDVIAAGVGGELGRWDMATGALVARGRSRDATMAGDVAISPDGSTIALYHLMSFQLGLFDATTLAPIGDPFPTGSEPFSPQFTADGTTVFGHGLFNELVAWSADPTQWIEIACDMAGRQLTADEWVRYIGADEPFRPTCDR